jgi:hypothetical protein
LDSKETAAVEPASEETVAAELASKETTTSLHGSLDFPADAVVERQSRLEMVPGAAMDLLERLKEDDMEGEVDENELAWPYDN